VELELSDKKQKDEKTYKDIKIKHEKDLNLSYDKKDLEGLTPHLISEITSKKQTLKIDAINQDIEHAEDNQTQNTRSIFPIELINPEPIDFIRRCTTNQEALEILDYLLKRKEIKLETYQEYKNKISQEGGLNKLIEESGGIKKPGYYTRKYYKKEFF
jgi:hypothetical protein